MISKSHTQIYKSRVDWWIWATLMFTGVIIFVVGLGLPWWITMLMGLIILGSMCLTFFSIWYVIDGESLIVYQFFMPHKYPIDKIKDIRIGSGILSAPALSTRRVIIRFNDRKILKSSMPLEISPADRTGFVKCLKNINPDITIIEDTGQFRIR